ncbi:MAG: hypothetical protein WBV73_04205 [Phormidium sp.]
MTFQAQNNFSQPRKLINSNNILISWLGVMIPLGIDVSLTSDKPLDKLQKVIGIFTLPTTVIIAIDQLNQQKKSELRLSIANEFKDFNNRRETINVRKMLEQEINVIELFPDAEKARDRTLNVERIRYQEALELPVKRLPRFEPNTQQISTKDSDDFKRKNCNAYIEAAIRDNLDEFFTDLEQIQLMVESSGIDYDYITSFLEPWKRMFKNADERLRGNLTKYVERQEYFNVLKILSEQHKDFNKEELPKPHHESGENGKETPQNKKEQENLCNCSFCSQSSCSSKSFCSSKKAA